MAVVKLAYRFALDPTPAQKRALRSHAGAARFAWNWALARCRDRYAAERKWYSGAELHKLWNTAKKADPALGWWGENSKCCYQEAFRNLDRALSDFIKSRRGQRKGKPLGFPKFKKRGRNRDSFRLTGVIRCAGNTVTLPRLGVIGTCESTGKLAGRIAGGRARILSATVTRTAQRWFVSVTVEEDRPVPACGLVLDRDVNAARNLLHLAASGDERLNACRGTVRPRPARQVPVKQEPGTPPGDKTGTALRQRKAAA